MRRSWILFALLLAGCSQSPAPTPTSPAGPDAGDTITGRERIGWDQPAGNASELATFEYAVYVDGVRTRLADVSCTGVPGPSGFPCSGLLPPMSNGAHSLELATFVTAGAAVVESPRAPGLRVVVAGLEPGISSTDGWPSGGVVLTSDGVRLRVDRLASGLGRPSDVALMPDGRLLFAERSGRVRVIDGSGLRPEDALRQDEDTDRRYSPLSLAVDPEYGSTQFVYLVYAADSADGPVVRLARYRDVDSRLGQRAVLAEWHVASGELASATVRFGPDGKLYLAFGGAGSVGALVRLNRDGTMPRDQAGTTPVLASGVGDARGLDWDPRSGILWMVDEDRSGGHLSGLSISPPPARGILRGRQDMPRGLGTLAFYRGQLLAAFTRDALIASSDGYILRLGFAVTDPTRVDRTERLLEGQVGPVHTVTTGADGAIYFSTDTTIGRLTAAP